MVERRPAVVLRGNKVLNVVMMNDKALSKTTESSSVWTLHENGRVLPLEPEVRVKNLRAQDQWIEVEAEGPETGNGAVTDSLGNRDGSGDDFLDHLTALIKDRRNKMPEGSYTTHLFSKGIEKIRKKTGEEAVELILARDKKEIVGEAADLVYHMMVLLEAEGLGLSEVIAELKRRES
jgi:phosphoribosyl-ATP pyrophosphohydrolase